jgi:pimeloyl-ACP methyl ester carboxylesterase
MSHTTEMLDVRGAPVELRRAGTGPCVLYLHSGIGDVDWLPVFDQLAEHCTVYHPSHPGFGKSGGLERIDDIDDLVLHYVDVITSLGLHAQSLNLVGSSFGGWVAAEISQRYPQLVQRLVIIDAAGLWIEGAPIGEMFGESPQELSKLLFRNQQHPVALAMASITDVSQLPEEVILPQFKAMEAMAKVAWNPYFHNPKLERRLDRIVASTLIVWGGQDRLIPLAHGERYAARIPAARLEVIEDCGHFPVLEQPEAVYRLLVDFLGVATSPQDARSPSNVTQANPGLKWSV